MGVGRELGMILQNGSLAVCDLSRTAARDASQFVGDVVDGDELAGPGRALRFEIVAVVVVELLQRLDE